MRRIFTFFLTFLLGMFVTALYAQTHTVSGTVIDKDANEPLIGANVLIKRYNYRNSDRPRRKVYPASR